MPRVHLTPCGTSVLSNLPADLDDDFSRLLKDLPGTGSGPMGDAAVRLHQFLAASPTYVQSLLDDLDAQRHKGRPSWSAECDSVRATVMDSSTDHVVLLASDSWEGLKSAVVNASLLAALLGDTQAPAVWLGTTQLAEQDPVCGAVGARVHVVRVPDLGPDDHDTLSKGLNGLFQRLFQLSQLQWAVEDGSERAWLAHLSGGYKSVALYMPLLLGLLGRPLEPLSADVVYERGTPIPVPLPPLDMPALQHVVQRIAVGQPVPTDFQDWGPLLFSGDRTASPLCSSLADDVLWDLLL